jgi:hypothetical protein
MKSDNRTKTVGTRVTEDESAALEQMAEAQGQSFSEWVRNVLLAQLNLQVSPAEQLLLAEIIALRNIMVNLAYAHNLGEQLSLEDIHKLLAEADAGKFRKALQRLQRGGTERVNSNGGVSGTE